MKNENEFVPCSPDEIKVGDHLKIITEDSYFDERFINYITVRDIFSDVEETVIISRSGLEYTTLENNTFHRIPPKVKLPKEDGAIIKSVTFLEDIFDTEKFSTPSAIRLGDVFLTQDYNSLSRGRAIPTGNILSATLEDGSVYTA